MQTGEEEVNSPGICKKEILELAYEFSMVVEYKVNIKNQQNFYILAMNNQILK